MTRKEFSTFVSAMKTYYPRENLLPNQQAMELWYQELADIPYNVASAALRSYVQQNKFSPTISEIRSMAGEVKQGDMPDWSEGWEQVMRSIRRYGMYNEAKALESMDDMTRTVVQRMGFQNLCLSENVSVERANFRQIYEQVAERKKKENLMPEMLKLQIDDIRAKELLQQINQNRLMISEE